MSTENCSIPQKSAKGSFYLIFRQVLVQGLNFTGGILLARFLSIPEYGFYGIVFYLFSFLMNFGDIGLATSLIQKQTEPNDKDYASIFTFQVVLTILVAIIFSLCAPWICSRYHLDRHYQNYLYLIALSFIFSTIRIIPAAKLERHIEFKWLSLIEIAQTIVFNGTAVVLAYLKFGALSFCLAFLLRTIIGSILTTLASPWHYRYPFFQWSVISGHLRFGLPVQIANLINLLKDSISPVIIGLMLNVSHTGIANMATIIATLPTMILFIMTRLLVPTFARALNNKELLNTFFSHAVFLANSIVAPLSVFVLLMVNPIIVHVFGQKWMVAKPLFYWVWFANLTVPTMLVCLSLFNGIGKSRINMYFSLGWMILTLGLGLPLIKHFGIIGYGMANLAVNISMVFLFKIAKKYIETQLKKIICLSWIPAIFMGGILLLYKHWFSIESLPSLIVCGVVFEVFAISITYLMHKSRIQKLKAFFSE